MLADMQRVRMLAAELPAMGWDIEVLTPAREEVRADVIEPDDSGFFAEGTAVHEVPSRYGGALALFGARSAIWRTLGPMYMAGAALLRSRRFDVVYLSTTAFPFFVLGPLWRRRFGIPYVLDFHDPWVRSKTAAAGQIGAKARFSRWISRCMERSAVLHAAAIVSVSPTYIESLRERYGRERLAWTAPGHHEVIPFSATQRDFDEAMRSSPVAPHDSQRILVRYVGAGGVIMSRSFTLICRALALLRAQGHPLIERTRIELYGTMYNWRPGDARLLEDIARAQGVGDLVSEQPQRIPYRESLHLLMEADGGLILGVDDPGYMPSKLFAYALSGKPLLAALHRDGPGYAQFAAMPVLGRALWFADKGDIPLLEAAATAARFLDDAAQRRVTDRRQALEPFLAPAMARRHAALFDVIREA